MFFEDRLSLNAGQKYCRMLQREHSAILLTFIKLPIVIKVFVLSIVEWPFYTILLYFYFYTDIPSSPNRKTSLRDDELIPGSLNREQRDSFRKPHSALIVSYKPFE